MSERAKVLVSLGATPDQAYVMALVEERDALAARVDELEGALRLRDAQILHALDPHRGGYTMTKLDRLRVVARASGLSDEEAAALAAAGGDEA